MFINDEKPLLFLNVDTPESNYGTSFLNKGESEIVKNFTEILIKRGVKKDWLGFISPYIGQTTLLQRKL